MDSCSTSTSTPYTISDAKWKLLCSLGWKSSSFVGGFNSNNGVFVRPTNNRISSTRVNMVRASASSSSANCILRFWTYRTALQKCNCPICARPISKLTPEASLLIMREVEVFEVLKNVQRYNRLLQGGVNGVIRKFFEVPNVFKRMLCCLMDPDRFRGNYYAMRSLGLLMSCIYNVSSFDFIPTGALGVRRLFDLCAIALVVNSFVNTPLQGSSFESL